MEIFLTVSIMLVVVGLYIGLVYLARWLHQNHYEMLQTILGILFILLVIGLLLLIGRFIVYPQVQSWLHKPVIIEKINQ